MYIYWCNWLQSFVTRESAFILFFSSPVLRDWKKQEGKNLLCIIIIIVVVAWEKWRPFTTSLLLLDSVGFLFVSLPSTKAVSTYLQPRNFLVFQNFKATLNIIIDNNINQFLVKDNEKVFLLHSSSCSFFFRRGGGNILLHQNSDVVEGLLCLWAWFMQ